MPITVLCPGCKTRFNVSEKFAGKEGPCPKCKAKIRIPDAPAGEVVVHAPAEHGGAVDTKGRPVFKPIAREDARIQLIPAMIVGAATMVLFFVALILRPEKTTASDIWMRTIVLVLVSPPIVVGGYSFLRNDELQPFRGLNLWLRATVCGLIFAAMWGVVAFYLVPQELAGEMWQWFFVAPVLLGVGAAAAFASLELDIENAFFLACFYLLLTMVLGVANNTGFPWNAKANWMKDAKAPPAAAAAPDKTPPVAKPAKAR